MANRVDRFVGFSILAGLITGLVSFLIAVFASLIGEWIGAGISFVAAALAFGLIAMALTKD